MKDDLQAKISSLTQTREKLVQLRTVLKNKVNNLLAANFIVLKREELSTETGLRKALSFHFDPITDTELFVVVEQIRSLNQSIALKNWIRRLRIMAVRWTVSRI